MHWNKAEIIHEEEKGIIRGPKEALLKRPSAA
jgi:hypothetical protein